MKVIRNFWQILVLIMIITSTNQVKAQFTEVDTDIKSVNQSSVAWGDYNNDGRLDLLLMGWDDEKKERVAHIYRNSESKGFVDINAAIKGVNSVVPKNLAWGDFDNDDNLDIILTGQDGYERVAHIYQNDKGTGLFKEIESSLKGVYSSSVAWGDYDNDGQVDLLLCGMSVDNTPITKIYKNNNGTFEEVGANLEGVFNGACAWGDYNNDGKLDLVLTGRNASKKYISKIYRNDGNGVFTDINADLIGVSKSAVAWGDYDNDGKLDIFILGVDNEENSVTKLYRNVDNNFSENVSAKFTHVKRGDCAWGDYDNDGRLDIIIMGMGDADKPITKIYKNNGDNTFTDIEAPIVQVDFGAVAWGDYDNDGRLDFVITGQDENYKVVTKVYQNTTTRVNMPPKAPTNLNAQVSGSSVTLSWAKAEDQGDPNSLTPTNELTYNIHLGLVSKGVERYSPMADTKTGFRKVVALGNVNHLTTWTIENLPSGTYHWSVQAIDNSFAGSRFAEEGTFTIQ